MSLERQSVVGWINALPDRWQVLPLRSLAAEGRTSFIDGDWIEAPYIADEGVRLLQTGNVGVGRYKEQGFRFVSNETFNALRCTEVEPGNVLICRLAEPVGRACLAPDLGGRMITSVDVCIMKVSPKHHAGFVVYMLTAPEYLGFMEGQCRGGTRDRVSRSFLGSVRVPVPSLDEQSAIAAFLDRETGKIDALVEEQRRLIELLKEKRQAAISHAVTRGLDPNAQMKPSGVEWLGEVPAHWEVAPVSYRYEVQLGRMLNEERSIGENLRPYLRVFDVQWERINIDDLPVMDFPPEARQRYRLEPGDLLVNEGGSYVGRSAIWRGELEECYYQKALHRLRSRDQHRDAAEFLLFVMEAATTLGVFVAGGNQTTIDHLTAEQLRRQRFPFPPYAEQVAIAAYIRALQLSQNAKQADLPSGAKVELLTDVAEQEGLPAGYAGPWEMPGTAVYAMPPVSDQAPAMAPAESSSTPQASSHAALESSGQGTAMMPAPKAHAHMATAQPKSN